MRDLGVPLVLLLAVLMLAAWGCGGGSSGAAPTAPGLTKDQEYDSSGDPFGASQVTLDRRQAQTFTAGWTGRLERVDLLMYQDAPGPLLLSVHPTVSGLPDNDDSSALGVIVVPDGTVSTSSGWHTFDLGEAGIVVTVGQVYAIVLSAPAASFYWVGSNTNGYPAGQACLRTDPAPWSAVGSGVDQSFRTWVRP